MIEIDIHPSDHPSFWAYTVFTDGERSIAAIQQFYNEQFRFTYWGPLQNSLADLILHNPNFEDYFEEHARRTYAIQEVRKLMWALSMRPIPREKWETHW